MPRAKAAAKKTTTAAADTNCYRSVQMQRDLVSDGWERRQLRRDNSKYLVDEPFLVFHREIPVPPSCGHWRKCTFSPIGQNGQNPETLDTSGVSASNSPGASLTMGVPIGAALPPPPGIAPAGGRPAVPAPSSGAGLARSLSDILTVQRMRPGDKSFVLGFDTEFYYDQSGSRHVLSWQFAFIQPGRDGFVQQLLVFSGDASRLLPFSFVLNYIIENFGVYQALGKGNADNGGFSFFRTHRWRVPVVNRQGLIRPKEFTSFDEAVKQCCNPGLANALQKTGRWRKADVVRTDTPSGRETHYRPEMDGYPVGYLNVYTEADRHAVPVTLVCHTGSADITTLDFGNLYEKDMLLRLSQIQGGLMTLKPYYMHNPVLSRHKYFYPVQLSVRDTMGFAPSKKKSLASLGATIGVPKLDVPKPFTKDDMLSYMMGDPLGFAEYAINDAVIALLYASELWGCNALMPITVSSAAGRAAVPVIKEYFGLSEGDDAGFNMMYRGLKKVKKGLVENPKSFGFLENTALEPLDFDCEMFQIFAKNAYKGGYNGSSRIGFYGEVTNDFDLENAYPTCMSLVPDVDWQHCVALEVTDKPLTRSMVRTPFDPVFAYVDFTFPEDVKYPCIPVTVDGCMVYPRSNEGCGGGYASAPELYLALMLGAEVRVRRLIVGNVLFRPDGTPSHSLFAVVKQFVNDRDVAKLSFGKGSLAELLLKEGVNSIYGKTAQDVIDKTSWSASSETMVDIGASQITSPYHASLTTAGVRCVLLSAMNQLEDLGYKVYSVTTDGFITDADLATVSGLDLYGFARLFQTARMMLVGDPTMWAVKHSQDDLVNLTTRGNASLIVGDSAAGVLPGVMAHNSFVTGEVPDSYEDRLAFVTQVLSRTGRLRTVGTAFVKFKELARRENRLDFSAHMQERMISMDFDMKRKPLRETLQDVPVTVGYTMYSIANFATGPYETVGEYQRYRSVSKAMTVLRSFKDWVMFFDKLDARADGKHRIVRDMEWSVLFSAVMAYRLRVPLDAHGGKPLAVPFLDDPAHSVADKVEWINEFFNLSKKPFTVNTWKDCRKQMRLAQMLPEALFIDKLDAMAGWVAYEECCPVE